jgi:hypothetical protein
MQVRNPAALFGFLQFGLPTSAFAVKLPGGAAGRAASASVLPRDPATGSLPRLVEQFPSMHTEADLRAAIESENAAIAELKTKIGEDPLRLPLQSALDILSFVSKAFLSPTAMERMRTPAELESWFAQAARHVERAARLRREVEQVATRNMTSVERGAPSGGP